MRSLPGEAGIGEVPPERWETRLYYDPDPKAPDRTYSKIGAFVRDFKWDPVAWHLPLPPRVADAMDRVTTRFGSSAIYFGGAYLAQGNLPIRIPFISIPDIP